MLGTSHFPDILSFMHMPYFSSMFNIRTRNFDIQAHSFSKANQFISHRLSTKNI